jgi:cellulose biosynthesis protein BcsQ
MKKVLRLTESELVTLVKKIINEQQEMSLQQYMDQLLENPVEFLNKLNTDEQFKNAYIKSYGSSAAGNPNFDFLQNAKIKHVLNNGVKITGQIKDDKTNEVLQNFEISTFDEYVKQKEFMADSKAKGRPLIRVGYSGRLDAVKNGKEVAEALNVPLGDNWFK